MFNKFLSSEDVNVLSVASLILVLISGFAFLIYLFNIQYIFVLLLICCIALFSLRGFYLAYLSIIKRKSLFAIVNEIKENNKQETTKES